MWWKQVQNPQLNFQQFGLRGKGNGMLVFQFIYVTLLLSLTMSQLIKRNILFFSLFPSTGKSRWNKAISGIEQCKQFSETIILFGVENQSENGKIYYEPIPFVDAR